LKGNMLNTGGLVRHGNETTRYKDTVS